MSSDDILKTVFRYGPCRATLKLDPVQVHGLREAAPSWFVDGEYPRIVTPYGELALDYDRSVKVDVFEPTIVRGWIKLGRDEDEVAIWKDPKTGRVVHGEEPPPG